MPYNGSGVYTFPGAGGYPYQFNTVIDQGAVNALLGDVQSALNTAATRDGQAVWTGSLNMGNNSITNVKSFASLPAAGQTAASITFNNANPNTNSGQATFGIDATGVYVNSSILGSGTQLPIQLRQAGTAYWSISTTGAMSNAVPSSGTPLTVTSLGVAGVTALFSAAVNGTAYLQVGAANTVLGLVESITARGDGNSTFAGRLAASYYRSDNTAIASGADIGMVLLGGQVGTNSSYSSSNMLYGASIAGVSEGTFSSSSAMPTGISFRTGVSGSLPTAVNVSFGTERVRISNTGNVTINTPSSGQHTFNGETAVGGTATNDNASAGFVGEYITATNSAGTAMTTGTNLNVTSISLTAGDWDVGGSVEVNFTGTNSGFVGATNATSATLPAQYLTISVGTVNGVATNLAGPVPQQRYSLSATTTVFLVAVSFFSGGAATAFGNIWARRRR